MRKRAITHPRMPHSLQPFPPVKTDAGLQVGKYTGRTGWIPTSMTDFNRFPFNNFTYCLTLFPKCFSSFPHGTCSLSVSRQYLALDGIYHPFWAAFPNNSTLWERITKHWGSVSRTGFSPSMTPYSKGLVHRPTRKTLLETTTRTTWGSQILNLSSSRFTRRY